MGVLLAIGKERRDSGKHSHWEQIYDFCCMASAEVKRFA